MNPKTKYYQIKHPYGDKITYFKHEDHTWYMFDTVGLWHQPKPGWILVNEGFIDVYLDKGEIMKRMTKKEVFLWLL